MASRWRDWEGRKEDESRRRGDRKRKWRSCYISGSFRVSMTAAMGMPKLEAGPQKSVPGVVHQSSVMQSHHSVCGASDCVVPSLVCAIPEAHPRH